MPKFTGSYTGCMATRARKKGSKLGTSARVCAAKVYGGKTTARKAKGKSRKGKGRKGSKTSRCLKVCVKVAK